MRAAALFAVVFVCSGSLAASFQEEDLAASDQRVQTSDLVRISSLGDGMLFVALRATAYEPHAMVGFVVGPQGTTELHATDYLPPDVVAPRSVGQIYAATLLDDGRLALSVGWTNAKARTINGIAILKWEANGWRRDRVIVMRGSVRDVAASPDDTLVAVATDVVDSSGNARIEVDLIDPARGIRSRLYDRSRSIDQAEQEALQIRLQRMPDRSVAVFDVAAGTMRLLSLSPQPACSASMTVSRDDGLFYPRAIASNCDSVVVRRLLSLTDVPPEARVLKNLTIDALRLHADGSLTVVRHGFDGATTQLAVTRYGKTSSTRLVPRVAARSALITDDAVEAVLMNRVKPKRIRIPVD
jgi:hypothetical protein